MMHINNVNDEIKKNEINRCPVFVEQWDTSIEM